VKSVNGQKRARQFGREAVQPKKKLKSSREREGELGKQ